jgi:hypothetical protein
MDGLSADASFALRPVLLRLPRKSEPQAIQGALVGSTIQGKAKLAKNVLRPDRGHNLPPKGLWFLGFCGNLAFSLLEPYSRRRRTPIESMQFAGSVAVKLQ